MDYVMVSDAARWIAVVASYLVAAVMMRAGWARVREHGWRTDVYPSPFATAGLVLIMVPAA